METTSDYDPDYSVPGPTPCSWSSYNTLEARLSILYYFMFLFSLCGNVLVLVIIYRFEKLTTVTNILLLNLVFSSLIFISSFPFWGVYLQLSDWIFGKVMCSVLGSVYYLGLYSSVLFLTLLTFDRHLAVVYALGASRLRNRGYAAVSCAAVWLISSLACIKPMILHSTFTDNMEGKTHCMEHPEDLENINSDHLSAAGFYIQLFLFFLLPLVVIIYCYLRIAITVLSSRIVTKFKTVRLIFVIVLLFFLCWTPFNIVLMIPDGTCEQDRRRDYADQITRKIAYMYFCFSPILYTFLGKKFRNYFLQILLQRFPGLKRHLSATQSSSSSSKNNMSTKMTPTDL